MSSSLLGHSWRTWAAAERPRCESIPVQRAGRGPPGGDPARLIPGTGPSMSGRCLPGDASAQSSWLQWGLVAVWCTALDQRSPGWPPAGCLSLVRSPGDPWPLPTSSSHLIYLTMTWCLVDLQREAGKKKRVHNIKTKQTNIIAKTIELIFYIVQSACYWLISSHFCVVYIQCIHSYLNQRKQAKKRGALSEREKKMGNDYSAHCGWVIDKSAVQSSADLPNIPT